MKKKKLTNKEITQAIEGLSNNCQILRKENLENTQWFALYLEYRKETEKFNKFVKGKIEEFEQQRSKDKKGA